MVRQAINSGARRAAFIDLEASGLCEKSWPIEVGWAGPEGAPRAMLIRPHDRWPLSVWDPQAEALHGVSMTMLENDGASPREVCDRLNEELAGAAVYSDAVDWDGFWLYRLFAAGGVKAAFNLFEFSDLIRPLARERTDEVFAHADALAPRRHRAADDVAHMQAVYRIARQAAAGD